MRKAVCLAAILVIVFSIQPLTQKGGVNANPLAMPASSTINIFSPTNTTYYTNSIILNFSVVTDNSGNSVRYTLDGKSDEKVTNFTLVSVEPMPPKEYFGKQYNWTQYTDMCNQAITDLPEGIHNLTVYSGYIDSYGIFYENGLATSSFIVDTGIRDSSPTPTATPYLPPNRNAPHLDPTFYLLPIGVATALVSIAIFIFRRKTQKTNIENKMAHKHFLKTLKSIISNSHQIARRG
jgi:hypothetical protein